MWGTVGAKLGAVALATLVIGLAACGGDEGDEPTAPEEANGNARSGAEDLDRFLMRKGEEPGFRQGARPGQLPRSRETITGVKEFVKTDDLPPVEARRLRREGFIAITFQPIRGPRNTAGITNVALYETAEGAKHNMAHDLRPSVLRGFGVTNFRDFPVPGVPGARGWTAEDPHGNHIGHVFWVQGRCFLVLGNEGPGPFAGPLSTGTRAIYDRTNGECP